MIKEIPMNQPAGSKRHMTGKLFIYCKWLITFSYQTEQEKYSTKSKQMKKKHIVQCLKENPFMTSRTPGLVIYLF